MSRVYFSRNRALVLFAKIILKSRGLKWDAAFTDDYLELLLFDIDTKEALRIPKLIKEHRKKIHLNKIGEDILQSEPSYSAQVFYTFKQQLIDKSTDIFVSSKTFRLFINYIEEPDFKPQIFDLKPLYQHPNEAKIPDGFLDDDFAISQNPQLLTDHFARFAKNYIDNIDDLEARRFPIMKVNLQIWLKEISEKEFDKWSEKEAFSIISYQKESYIYIIIHKKNGDHNIRSYHYNGQYKVLQEETFSRIVISNENSDEVELIFANKKIDGAFYLGNFLNHTIESVGYVLFRTQTYLG